MADDDMKEAYAQERMAINTAYAFLVGEENSRNAGAFTFEEGLALRIEEIEGKGNRVYPGQIERVRRMADRLKKVAEEVKLLDPSVFEREDESVNADTSEA